MSNLQANLGTALFQQLDALRETKGRITAEDAGAIVSQLMQTRNDIALQQEIARMIQDIEDAKSEIMALSSNAQTNKQAISDASLHLDTVIKSTEEATNSFMDAASAIQELAIGIGGQKEEDIKAVCMRIYEACNFQDLSTQRINKVIKLIKTLEAHILNLHTLFAIQTDAEKPHANGEITLPKDDRELLNGPQLPQNAISQDDVDALFKSLNAGN